LAAVEMLLLSQQQEVVTVLPIQAAVAAVYTMHPDRQVLLKVEMAVQVS
jgi:hypothetical protein